MTKERRGQDRAKRTNQYDEQGAIQLQPSSNYEAAESYHFNEPIVFFGSGPVAAKALALLAQDFEIEAVITKPPPAHHRGEFPVLALAKRLRLKTYTPTNKSQLTELFTETRFSSRLGVVIDYGIIISQAVIDYFALGIVNSHFSLLPRWRGADPISFSILSGDKTSGVSLMVITAGLDEGPLLAQVPYNLPKDVTTPRLTAALIDISHEALKQYLPRYISGQLKPYPQPNTEPSYARKLTKADGIIDWQKPAAQLEREIRAFVDWPKSRTTLAGKEIIITKAHATDLNPQNSLSPFKTTDGLIGMPSRSEGVLIIERLKPVGKPEMSASEFLRGYRLN